MYYIILFIIMSISTYSQAKLEIPKTKKIPYEQSIHNFTFNDYYQWLENKDNPEVKAWSKEQHEYTLSTIKNYPEIIGLRDEITKYLDRDIIGSPFFVKFKEFFYAKRKGEQQSKLYTRIDGKEILIFDPEINDPSGKSSINGLSFNEEGDMLAIGIQKKGNEINQFRIIDTKNGKTLYGPYDDIYSWSWRKDQKSAYVTIRNKEMIDNQLPLKTYLFNLGDDFANKKFIIAPKDAKDNASIWDSDESDFTIISEGDFYSNSISIRKQSSSDLPKLIYSSKEFSANINIIKDKIFIYTNHLAPNFKLMTANTSNPEQSNWKDLIPESNKVMQNYIITPHNIIIQYKEDVLSHLEVFSLEGKFISRIQTPEIANIAGISFNKYMDMLFVTLSSFTNSSKIFKLNPKSLQWEFFYQDILPISTENITSKLIFYPSLDGTKIPLFIIHQKSIKLDGNNPTLLYGYGGFNISMGPSFIGTTASFINRGGIYAIACIRGGNEFGENWHRGGMLLNKQNSFNDFIAAGEYLIKENYTSSKKLAIKGGSNGGLLIGASIIQRPDLFSVGICAVPLLDMLNYHKFLIARYWIPEYGDPSKKEDFINILKYTPYQNIRTGFNYPTMLIKAGENDSRVDPLHAKKFAAALQNNPGQKNPILLHVDFDSGHGSGQSIIQQVDNIETEWRFLMHHLGF